MTSDLSSINDFLEEKIAYFDEVMKTFSEEKTQSWKILNEFFINEILEKNCSEK